MIKVQITLSELGLDITFRQKLISDSTSFELLSRLIILLPDLVNLFFEHLLHFWFTIILLRLNGCAALRNFLMLEHKSLIWVE